MHHSVKIKTGRISLYGDINYHHYSRAWVIFVHGSGSSRHSVRNTLVAKEFNRHNYGTFLFDLLTESEDQMDTNRFNIPLLADRLIEVTQWFMKSPFYKQEPIVFFGASTGAAAALMAVGKSLDQEPIAAVISRGGRPDLAGIKFLHRVSRPVLLLVGSLDFEVVELNHHAQDEIAYGELELIQGATHLFEEPGTLDQVVQKSIDWLELHLPQEIKPEEEIHL
jgi:putative phosphoribosyl transferase